MGEISMGRSGRVNVLVHEWVTGGGMVDLPLAGSWIAQGAAMRRAIAADFARIAGRRAQVSVTLDARLRSDTGPWITVPIAAGEHDERIQELARAADFTVVVAPETRGVLASLTRDLERAGARFLGSAPSAVLLSGDKARCAERLQAAGIDTPETILVEPARGLPKTARYPAVLKPIDGAGSMNTFFLEDTATLPDNARTMGSAVMQPFIFGTPMSASFLVNRGGAHWPVAVGIQHMEVIAGGFSYRGGTLPADCLEALPQVEPALGAIEGLRGFVGVDFIWDSERAHATIIEINPRPTTSLVAICRVLPPGCLARAWLDACEGSGQTGRLAGLVTLVHRARPVSFSTEDNSPLNSDESPT
jgi:predicted ATP-grasp superfamily ATP-dependent carboligase